MQLGAAFSHSAGDTTKQSFLPFWDNKKFDKIPKFGDSNQNILTYSKNRVDLKYIFIILDPILDIKIKIQF